MRFRLPLTVMSTATVCAVATAVSAAGDPVMANDPKMLRFVVLEDGTYEIKPATNIDMDKPRILTASLCIEKGDAPSTLPDGDEFDNECRPRKCHHVDDWDRKCNGRKWGDAVPLKKGNQLTVYKTESSGGSPGETMWREPGVKTKQGQKMNDPWWVDHAFQVHVTLTKK